MKQSGVTFDFDSFKKRTVGAGSIILTPTIHVSKGGEFSIYCIDDSKYIQVRFARSSEIVGIELLEKKEHNSYSIKNLPSSLRGKIYEHSRLFKFGPLSGYRVSFWEFSIVSAVRKYLVV
ncbi:hypothetical protein [Lactococcus garvieae]|uniref:hypothetical protein n=1 Tax=Lactococcus garvieae TaxID=1363 RepID=UPI00035F03A1|nr:hypothetical protein [Lactococcus garvieae]